MERLPTELVIHILSYMSTKELKITGFISFKYRSLVIPFLFRCIRPWWFRPTRLDVFDLITCLQNNHRISLVVRVLDVRAIRLSQQSLEEIQQIMEITARWEGLILPVNEHIPLGVFDDKTKMQLRRLEFTKAIIPSGPKFSHLLINILPSCTNLIDLDIPEMEDNWFKTCDPDGSAITMWMNRLEKYCGPSYPLSYLHNSTPLHRLRTTSPASSPMLQKLGLLVGQQLLALHVQVPLTRDILVGRDYPPPSLLPSSFPNLRYFSWFMIKSQLGSVPGDLVRTFLAPSLILIIYIQGLPRSKFFGDEATLDVNMAVFDAIQQLHYLRHIWFRYDHEYEAPIGSVLTFVEKVQRASLPYLHTICLWTPLAPTGDPSTYTFRKEEAESVNGGGYTKWACKTNLPVFGLMD